MRVTHCKINRIKNPVGFDLGIPRASWIVEDTAAKHQKSACVEVSDDAAFDNILWSSGEAELSSLAAEIDMPLEAYKRYWWRVSVTADNGETAVSDTNYFETAKLGESWDAEWITVPEGMETENPIFEKTFKIYDHQDETCAVRLYACGLGLYNVYLNGEKVGHEYLAPGCNDYNMWLQYQTYELDVKPGNNVLRFSLGNGWFKGRFGLAGGMSNYGDAFHLIAEVRQDGDLLTGTDTSWKVRSGAVGSNGIYDGETFDPISEGTDWENAASDPDKTLTARLHARLSLPIVIHKELKPVELINTPSGETVLDFGQNFAGIIRMHVNEPAGTKVHLQFGEVLQGGNFYRDNLRGAKAEYIYISDGQERTVEQNFTYYGYRYVKVSGMTQIDPADFTGLVLYSDLEVTGSIKTDNAKINRLISNCVWGQRSNYMDIPTDCPQRNERLGWTGDTQVFSGTACFNMDSYAFLSKHMHDVYMTQKELGCVTNVVPAFQETQPTSCAWGDVATIVPWNLYIYYGDKAILSRQYESMKLWVDYMRSKDIETGGNYLWITDLGFGDWLALDHDDPKERYFGGTDHTFLHSAYYYYSTDIVAKAADVLGCSDDALTYGERAKNIKEAFIHRYFTPEGLLAVNTQTAYAVALFMGLCPEEAVQLTADTLAKKIMKGGGKIKTGFIGTPILCRVLSDHGYSDLAYRLLFNEENPSWLYAVNLGATTIWERWNSLNPDGSINGTDMNSLNHYSYGAIVEWMYRHIAGIRPKESEPGFKSVIIAPELNMRMKHAEMSYMSAAGEYRISWAVKGSREVHLEVAIPFGAEAEIRLPGTEEAEKLTAGEYVYDYEMDAPLWESISADTNFNKLRENPLAKPVMDKYIPGWHDIPTMFTDVPLRALADDPYLSITYEVINAMDEELKSL